MKEEQILIKAIDAFCVALQVTIGMEEICELIEALARLNSACNRFFFRGRITMADLISELVDVEIVCNTLRILINDDTAVNHIKQCKLKRLEDRINDNAKDKTETK